ncbi:MAG: hypothetical protein MR039_01710 [Elusimicrobia bacterium]|nr:hypothetical protein [Elusimicrobiota bacterium]MDD7501644.1 hypothetical protein [Elusimicrobiota bacterium]MDY5728714.1 hypothetical protein [Elusimicrobiaceae bacterium]
MRNLFFPFHSSRGQATTEVVLLFPLLVIFILFIIKIFGLLILSQKMEIAGYYVGRRYQLQSHETDYYRNTWDRRYLQKDIQKKVENYLGFDNPGMRKFLSLNDLKIKYDTSGTWTKVELIARTRPPRIRFLCKYDRDHVCQQDEMCVRGYNYLCETGGEVKVIKYIGHNERPAPYQRPEAAN